MKITLLDNQQWDINDLKEKAYDDEFYYGYLGKYALSSTSIKHLLSSPKTYYNILQYGSQQSQALRDGWLFHTCVLEPHVFEEQNALNKLELFTSISGAKFYGKNINSDKIRLVKKDKPTSFPEKISTVDGKGELLLTIIDEEDPSIIRALNRRVDIVVSYPEKQTVTQKVVDLDNKVEEAFALDNVLFITGYSYLTRKSKKVLDDVAETIKKETFSFVIQGHVCCTDGTVDAVDKKTNQRNLSVARAKYVYDFFIEKGINRTRMSYEGLAHRFPLGGSEDKDRRVEIKVVSK